MRRCLLAFWDSGGCGWRGDADDELRRRRQWLGATVSGRSGLWRPAEVGAGGVLRASDS
jgi:hypothetical protein